MSLLNASNAAIRLLSDIAIGMYNVAGQPELELAVGGQHHGDHGH